MERNKDRTVKFYLFEVIFIYLSIFPPGEEACQETFFLLLTYSYLKGAFI